MLILALETSGLRGSVAVLRDGELLHQLPLPSDQRSAQSLIVTIQQLLQQCDLARSEVQLIAVTHGPGSFTGLRVGLMAAKTLAYAWNCDVIGVDTLAVIAKQALAVVERANARRIWAVSDAQRQQLFAASFEVVEQCCELREPSAIIPRETWLEQLQSGDVVCGAGLKPLLEKIPTDIMIASEQAWQPLGATVGHLGWRLSQDSATPRTWQSLVPHYLRASAAEENPKFQPPRKPA